MDLRKSMADAFATRYPQEAAAALDTRPAEEIARILRELTPDTAAAVLRRLSPGMSSRSVEHLEPREAARIIAALGTDDALALLRRATPGVRDAVIEAMPAEKAKAVNTVIRFPAGTAGALMDPRVLALPADMKVEEAVRAVRREAEHVHYHIYIIDREGRLTGVLDLRELLLARSGNRLEAVMKNTDHRLSPSADRHAIAGNRGWRYAHSLPVVDGRGRLLGAVHYRILRKLEGELYHTDTKSGESAAQALGDLFWAGVGGVINALTTTITPPRNRPARKISAPPTGDRQSSEASNGHDLRTNEEE